MKATTIAPCSAGLVLIAAASSACTGDTAKSAGRKRLNSKGSFSKELSAKLTED